MFEQAYVLEYGEPALLDAGEAHAASPKRSQLAMPLMSICGEQDAVQEADASNAIFGDAWPGLAIAFG